MLFSKSDIAPRAYRDTVTLHFLVSSTDDYGVQSLVPLVAPGSGSGSGSGTPVTVVRPASVVMLSSYAKMNYYQTADIEAYEVRMRYYPDKFQAITWNGKELGVDSIEDVGNRQRELRILASRRAVV